MERTHRAIALKLIERGEDLFRKPREQIPFTGIREADDLLNDLQDYPHAFFIGCLMDRQMKAERAWMIPHRLRERLGGFEFSQLERLTQSRLRDLMTKPDSLHRFGAIVARDLHSAIAILRDAYHGDASRIWAGRPSSAEVVLRFLEFPGIGPKIATMAANILARDFKIPLSDHYSIDISADVHVRRVFERLGLISRRSSLEAVIYRARAVYPEFPGMLDLPCWEIGRSWCRPKNPRCPDCFMRSLCPSAERP